MAANQQHFTIGVDLKDVFKRFCEDQGLDPKLVFLAGWRAYHKAEHDARSQWFEGISEWQQEILKEWGASSKTNSQTGSNTEEKVRTS